MRHHKYDKKLGRPFEHRSAMLKNLMTSLLKYERIVTTLPKAKFLRRKVERIITWARKGGLAHVRLIERFIKDKDVLKKLMDVIGPRFKDRNGGYTRILRLKNRIGDDALMVIIELVVREKRKKKVKKGKKEEEKAKEKEKPAEKAVKK